MVGCTGGITFWRGVWYLFDEWFLPSDAVASAWIPAAACGALLLSLASLRSVVAAPFALDTDEPKREWHDQERREGNGKAPKGPKRLQEQEEAPPTAAAAAVRNSAEGQSEEEEQEQEEEEEEEGGEEEDCEQLQPSRSRKRNEDNESVGAVEPNDATRQLLGNLLSGNTLLVPTFMTAHSFLSELSPYS